MRHSFSFPGAQVLASQNERFLLAIGPNCLSHLNFNRTHFNGSCDLYFDFSGFKPCIQTSGAGAFLSTWDSSFLAIMYHFSLSLSIGFVRIFKLFSRQLPYPARNFISYCTKAPQRPSLERFVLFMARRGTGPPPGLAGTGSRAPKTGSPPPPGRPVVG